MTDGTTTTTQTPVYITEEDTTPFTAEWVDPPSTYSSSGTILRLRFSEEAPISYHTLRGGAISVNGGRVPRARRVVRGSNLEWNIAVRSARGTSHASLFVQLRGQVRCGQVNAICTADDRQLSNSPSVTL